jgi:hypothetical protein
MPCFKRQDRICLMIRSQSMPSAAEQPSPALRDGGTLMNRPLPIVSTCRARDLPVLEIAARKLPEMIPCRRLYVVAPDDDCRKIQRRLGREVCVIAENDFIPGMTLGKLRSLAAPGFPKMAGWYFQQFLKLQFAFVEPEDDFYLIWDADTIPLQPMRFFDSAGRMLLTQAVEYHVPYFETYRRLFGEEPHREFSFIAQHLLVQKSIAREMLAAVERHIEGAEGWAWKIMRVLPPDQGVHTFSEYETYGHYIKNHHPDRVRFVNRQWLREPAYHSVQSVPSTKELEALAEKYEYAAFERVFKGWRLLAKRLINRLRPRR